jgi:hypothetical protein
MMKKRRSRGEVERGTRGQKEKKYEKSGCK